jgi:hypothetical protein
VWAQAQGLITKAEWEFRMPNIKFVTSRANMTANDFIDWKAIEPNDGNALPFADNVFDGLTAQGRPFRVLFDCRFVRNEQGPAGATWNGCFQPGDGVLCNGTISEPVVIVFPQHTCFAIGAQMEPDATIKANDTRQFVGYINLIDELAMGVAGEDQVNGVARILKAGDANDNSSAFLGAEWTPGFQGVEFYCEVRKPGKSAKAIKFAVNRVELRF